MPRRKSSNMIADVIASAEKLRRAISALPPHISDKVTDVALAIVTQPVKRRGRPPKKGPKRRGRPPKVETSAQA